MKSWLLISIGALAGSAATGIAAYAYQHRLTNFSNEMQYINAASHVVSYHNTLQEIDVGATDKARLRVDALLQGSEVLMTQYESQLQMDRRNPPSPQVVKDAKQRLELYHSEARAQ